MESKWDELVAAYHRGLESCKFGKTLTQFSYYAQTQQVVLQIDGVSEGHDAVDFMDRLSSEGDFWHGGSPGGCPPDDWPTTPTPSEQADLERGEQAHHQGAATGAMGQGSQSDSIPIGGTSAPAGYESVANAWQWRYSPPSIAHPDQSEWHTTKPDMAAWSNPAHWDDMRRSHAAIGADHPGKELGLSRPTCLQQQGRKTGPQRLTQWTRNSKEEVWALHAFRAQGPFQGRPTAIEDCMNMLLEKPVALTKDYSGDVNNVQYVSSFMGAFSHHIIKYNIYTHYVDISF